MLVNYFTFYKAMVTPVGARVVGLVYAPWCGCLFRLCFV
jgi:hypothetical protein